MKKTSLLMIVAVAFWACGTNTNEEGQVENAEKQEETSAHEGHDHEGHDHEGHEHAEDGDGVSPEVAVKPGQKVFWISPKHGETVKSPFTVQMGVEGMTVEPAGHVNEDKGHHHVMINKEAVAQGELLEQGDPTIIHYGQGQTEAEIELEPGAYKLTLQFANGAHKSYGPQMSETIKIVVE